MSESTQTKYDERVVGRAILATLLLFLVAIPAAITLVPGLQTWQQVWLAFGASCITVLLALLVTGVTLELSKRVRAFLDASQQAASNQPTGHETGALSQA